GPGPEARGPRPARLSRDHARGLARLAARWSAAAAKAAAADVRRRGAQPGGVRAPAPPPPRLPRRRLRGDGRARPRGRAPPRPDSPVGARGHRVRRPRALRLGTWSAWSRDPRP